MARVTADMTITLDGYASGRNQSREKRFGDLDPDRLHGWMFDHADESAEEIAAITAAGAYVMGRKMFAHVAGVALTPVSSRTTPHVTHVVYRR